jgi:hypothetical protein
MLFGEHHIINSSPSRNSGSASLSIHLAILMILRYLLHPGSEDESAHNARYDMGGRLSVGQCGPNQKSMRASWR